MSGRVSKRLVIMKPIDGKGNPYIDTVRLCLESEGFSVITPKMALLPKYVFKRIGIANFNWYENVERSNRVKTYYTVLRRKLMILYLKYIRRSKIIITIHNKKNHHDYNFQYSEKMLAWLVNKSDEIVILCNITREYLDDLMIRFGYQKVSEKINHIGHVNFVNAYNHSQIDEFCKIAGKRDEECFELAYFGTISDYKNVEIICKLAPMLKDKSIHITVAGGGKVSYLRKMEKQFKPFDNVTFSGKFIPDESIWGFIKGADCILLPYNKESILNSAAVILALSVGTNVLCPDIGTTKDFPDGLAYVYDYSNDDEHLEKLYEKVCEAYSDYKTDRKRFNERIAKLNSIVVEDYSYEKTKSKYRDLYERLLDDSK